MCLANAFSYCVGDVAKQSEQDMVKQGDSMLQSSQQSLSTDSTVHAYVFKDSTLQSLRISGHIWQHQARETRSLPSPDAELAKQAQQDMLKG